ncbi:hypothetical protein STENM223S_05880 [Streptomyces tendae]
MSNNAQLLLYHWSLHGSGPGAIRHGRPFEGFRADRAVGARAGDRRRYGREGAPRAQVTAPGSCGVGS